VALVVMGVTALPILRASRLARGTDDFRVSSR
jgi:hypothetical protein